MREFLLQLKTQAAELWQKMTGIQKTIMICSAVLLFGVLAVMARGATRPDFGALLTLKDDQEAGLIIQKLTEKKIEYQLLDNGTSGGATIMIPTKDIAQTRLELASQGFPTGGVVGFESFDTTQFGETDTDRRARYLRALQGELTRTIEGMAEVDKARVHIVIPEPSLFMEEQKNATAAIMLKFKPYKSLNEEQARGMVKLVTNSVEALKSENVTIVDTTGNILSEDVSNNDQTMEKKLTVSQVDLQKQIQKEIQNSAQTMLERVVGIGKAVVRVQLALDFDKIQTKKQEYGNKVPRSIQVNEETSKSTDSNQGGVPGTTSNIPGYPTQNQQSGSSESSKSEKIVNNEIDTYEEMRDVAPGSIKRLSVAVVVDKDITPKVKKDIEDVIKGAVGFETDRGDQISVAGMPFNTEYQDEMNREIANAQKQQQMLIFGGLAALALLLIGGVVTSIIIKRRKARELERQLAKQLESELANNFAVKQGKGIGVFVEQMSEYEETEAERIKNQVEKIAKDHPDDIAQLLKTWLAEE